MKKLYLFILFLSTLLPAQAQNLKRINPDSYEKKSKAEQIHDKAEEVKDSLQSKISSIHEKLDIKTKLNPAKPLQDSLSNTKQDIDTESLVDKQLNDSSLNKIDRDKKISEEIKEYIAAQDIPTPSLNPAEELPSSNVPTDIPAIPDISAPGQVKDLQGGHQKIKSAYATVNDTTNMLQKTKSLGSDYFPEEADYIPDSANVKSLEKALEQQAGKHITELGVLDEAANKAEEMKNAFLPDMKKQNDLRQSQDMVQQQIQQRAQQLGLSETGFQEKLQDVTKKAAKYQKKFDIIPHKKGAPGTKQNATDDFSLRERLIWGLNFQVNRKEPFGLDFAPQISYKTTPRLIIGAGGTYRLAIDANEKKFDIQGNQMYGGRLFADYLLLRSFYVHAELERNRTEALKKDTSGIYDIKVAQWQNTVLAGVKKKYTLKGRITGTAELLYNPAFNKAQNPYKTPVVFRMGVEMAPPKKKKKEKD